MPGVGSDLAEAVGPVVTAPSEYLDRRISEMDLHSVAVELDLVNSSLTTRHLLD